MPNDLKLPPLPDVWSRAYQWCGLYGTTKFSPASHNGREFDRVIDLYTAEQLRERDRQIVELCAQVCEAQTDVAEADRAYKAALDIETDDIDDELRRLRHASNVSLYNAGPRRCATAIRALIKENK